ncbi:MAG: hypothetical protein PVF83_12465 [Anaerolineales bacterium]|jgi:hypothetical protein
MTNLDDKKVTEIALKLEGYSPEQRKKILNDIKENIDVDAAINQAFSNADREIEQQWENNLEAAKQREIAEVVKNKHGTERIFQINKIDDKYNRIKAQKAGKVEDNPPDEGSGRIPIL